VGSYSLAGLLYKKEFYGVLNIFKNLTTFKREDISKKIPSYSDIIFSALFVKPKKS